MPTTYGIDNIDYLKPIPDEVLVETVISSAESVSTEVTPFEVTITFHDAVTGFVVGDIVAGNASLSNFAGSGRVYTVDVTPTIAGTVTIDVAKGVAISRVGYENAAATQFEILFVIP